MEGILAIAIELPGKRRQAFGGSKPKGSVTLGSGEGSQKVAVPVAVARILDKLQQKGDLKVPSIPAFMELLERIALECAWKRLLGLIEARDYSSKEADGKLKADGYEEGIRCTTLERARSCHLIDDGRFGEFFARRKIDAGWGRLRIQRELELKGIPPSSVPGWPDDFFSDEDDYDRARALASRKHLNGKNDFQKLMRLLTARGFPSSVAYRVAHELGGSERDRT